MLEHTINFIDSPYTKGDKLTDLWVIPSTDEGKKLWLEFQKIKIRYGDPITGESGRSALGRRNRDWKRTIVNHSFCMVDNPFYEPIKINDRIYKLSSVSKPTEDPMLVLQKPQIGVISDIIVKEELANNNSTENKEKDEIKIDVQETEDDEIDDKKSPRITMRRIFLVSFFTLLDLLDPYIAILLMKNQ